MDKTVPAGAALLLDFIAQTEVGSTGRASYDVIYGHNQGKIPKPITRMALGDLIDAQNSFTKRFKSSASGRYQFMRATLQDLSKELGLRGSQIFDPDLQDRLGYHLLIRRGYVEYTAGKISMIEFARRLAMEWASFPVLAKTKGGGKDKNGNPLKLMVERGQSFYAGDPLNKALVKPDAIESLLRHVKAAGNGQAKARSDQSQADQPEPFLKSKRAWLWGYIGTVSPAAALGAFDWRVQMLIVGSIIGISIYSIITMKQVRDKLSKLIEAL